MTPIPDRPWTRHLMLTVAVLLLLSCGAHGIFGARMIRQVLIENGASADILETVTLGWSLGSAAMLAFALIVLAAWRRARQGDGSGFPGAAIVAVVYFSFGLGAFLYSRFSPHFLVLFMIPAALLGAAVFAASKEAKTT
jgi:hypothetical protein